MQIVVGAPLSSLFGDAVLLSSRFSCVYHREYDYGGSKLLTICLYNVHICKCNNLKFLSLPKIFRFLFFFATSPSIQQRANNITLNIFVESSALRFFNQKNTFRCLRSISNHKCLSLSCKFLAHVNIIFIQRTIAKFSINNFAQTKTHYVDIHRRRRKQKFTYNMILVRNPNLQEIVPVSCLCLLCAVGVCRIIYYY